MHDGMEHTHHHEHHHTHATQSATDKKELKALVKFTLEHNEHHLEDLHAIIHQLEDFGETDAAQNLSDAMAKYKEGNLLMQTVFDMIKE